MQNTHDDNSQPETFSMRVAARMTGVSPERMRAWESRHDAIRPERTPGGTRRYSLSDLDRLRLLREVVEAGHRIGDVAGLDLVELKACLPASAADVPGSLDDVLVAATRLDTDETRRLLLAKQNEVGPIAFARDLAIPICAEIGRRWEDGSLSISAEHMATGIIRSMLVDSLGRSTVSEAGPRVVFATPSGERHDVGLLVAALVAKQAGALSIFVGADVPDEDLIETVATSRAEALALGFVISTPQHVEQTLHALRRGLADSVAIWIGGAGIAGCPPVRGVDRIENFDRLEAFVLQLSGSAPA